MPVFTDAGGERILPKIGVAFGGGGIKGAAHVGALKVFEEHQIPIHMVAGTSAGSFIASLYAAGYTANNIHELFCYISLDDLLKVRPGRTGLMPGNKYEELVRVCTENRNIEDLHMPLRIVAVDLISWQKKVFSTGNIARLVRASSSLPGAIMPIKYEDMLLADGYLLDNCPSDIVRQMGADIVIAIDLHHKDHDEPKNMFDIIVRSIEVMAYHNQKMDADIILRPINQSIAFFNKKKSKECYLMGEQCALENIEEIVAVIEKKTRQLNGE